MNRLYFSMQAHPCCMIAPFWPRATGLLSQRGLGLRLAERGGVGAPRELQAQHDAPVDRRAGAPHDAARRGAHHRPRVHAVRDAGGAELTSAARSNSGSGRSERAAARPSQALTSEEVPLVRLDPCPAAVLRVHLDELLFGRNPSRQRAILVVRVRHREPVGLPGQIGQWVAERRKLPVQHAKDPWQHTAFGCSARRVAELGG